MKQLITTGVLLFLLIGCFDSTEVTPPQFVQKLSPDSLNEQGIDAHPDNAIYLEWIEPPSADDELIAGYNIYRGKLIDGKYVFNYLDEVMRNDGLIYDSDNYIDYEANLDTTYYYYLRSYNDFTESKETSDTVNYKLTYQAVLNEPNGEITDNAPYFEFMFSRFNDNRINKFYFRLEYNDEHFTPIIFAKIFRNNYSKTRFYFYLNEFDSYTTILYDVTNKDDFGSRYLVKGDYRWRMDAVSGELGGAPETEGSESDWMYFTVK